MKRREFIVLLGSAALAPIPARAGSESAASLAARLVGTWRFVSSLSTRSDGTTFDRWGNGAQGTLMFDPRGGFAQIIVGEESRMFGGKSIFSFGTYVVDEENSTIALHTQASSNPKQTGHKQRRIIVSMTTDELKLVNPVSTSGNQVETVWRRAKPAS
jgi:hypothetical protein